MNRRQGHMDNLRNRMQRHTALMIAVLAVTVVIGALGGEAFAVGCAAGGGVPSPGLCTISQTVPVLPATCPYVLTLGPGESLLITGTGHIKCDGPGADNTRTIDITVPDGNMEMLAGSKITAENTNTTALAGGTNGDITITVSGNFIMRGPVSGVPAPAGANSCAPAAGVAGACISSSDSDGGGNNGARAGNIEITVGNFPITPPVGVFTMEPGSAVLANHTAGSAGEIVITAGKEMDVDGLVRSFGGIGGVPNQPRGGGPITLKSGCLLVITPDGLVSSEGLDPGADLVHLEGCEVQINGIVQSIALQSGGHSLPTNPPNRCNADPVAHPSPPAYTACVEVWGNNVVINSILPNKGEVSADGVRELRAWIDIIAKNDLTIINDTVGNYSVHANAATGNPNSNSFGGVITLKALEGTFESGSGTVANPGNAPAEVVQANATGVGSDGGIVTIQAALDVLLHTSSIQAQGPDGSNTRGGTIGVKSFNGQVSGTALAGSELNASGGVGGSGLGQVTLSACSALPYPAGTYGGTITPLPPLVLFPVCGGAPTPPTAFALAIDCNDPLICLPGGDCVKRGMKFRDDGDGVKEVGEPGLGGWKIRAYTAAGFETEEETLADGSYEFNTLTCGVEYTFCEVLQSPWTQTFPPALGGKVVSCAGLEPDPAIILGPRGYRETLVANSPSENNDFGNFLQNGVCPKFPSLSPDVTIIIDPNNATQIQAAINALPLDKTLLILPLNGKKTESIIIDKRIKVFGCSITLDGANGSGPVVTIGAGAAMGTTTDVHATGTTGAGYLIAGQSHTVKNVRSFGNGIGFLITGSGNTVLGAQGTTGNGIGFKIEGSGNTVDSASGVTGNTSHGAQLTASATGNTVKKSTFTGNSGEGIFVEGTGNIISENKLYSNVLNGINVTGASTQILKNLAGDKGKGNGLDGILVSGTGGPLTENTARGNLKNGIEVTGTGHTLTKNTAGGDAQQANTLCEFVIGASNLDGGSGGTNKANGQSFTFGAGGEGCVNP
jgi:parallel beta-helix repeat protein